jgi:hypothetical protein
VRGRDWHGVAGKGVALHGAARQSKARFLFSALSAFGALCGGNTTRPGRARPGRVWPGMVGLGKDRPGEARQGWVFSVLPIL